MGAMIAIEEKPKKPAKSSAALIKGNYFKILPLNVFNLLYTLSSLLFAIQSTSNLLVNGIFYLLISPFISNYCGSVRDA